MALDFEREHDNVLWRAGSLISPTEPRPITISAWCRYDTQTNGRILYVLSNNGASNSTRLGASLVLGVNSASTRLSMYSSGSTDVDTQNSANFESGGTNTWIHCLWTWQVVGHGVDPDLLEMWANGVQVYSAAFDMGADTASDFTIVGGITVDNFAADHIAEFAVWSDILSDSEIASLAGGTPASRVRGEDLVSHIPMYNTTHVDYVLGEIWNEIAASPSIVDHAPVAPPFGWGMEWQGISAGAAPPAITVPIMWHHYSKSIRSS